MITFKMRNLAALLALCSMPVISQASFDPSVLNAENQQLLKLGLWRDPLTKLMWTRCAVGQTWNGQGCDGTPKKMDWTQAVAYAKSATLAGYSDWRVPASEEYMTLVRCGLDVSPEQAARDPRGIPNVPADSVLEKNGCYSPGEASSYMFDGPDPYYDSQFNKPAFFYRKIFGFDPKKNSLWSSTTKSQYGGIFKFAFLAGDVNFFREVDSTASESIQVKGKEEDSWNSSGLILVREGTEKNTHYATALQMLPGEMEKIKKEMDRRKRADEETAAAMQRQKEAKELEQKRYQRLLQEYKELTAAMRKNPRVNDIAQQGRILEVRGDQVRIEVYRESCIEYASWGCRKSEYVPNGAQAWINKNELYPARWLFRGKAQ